MTMSPRARSAIAVAALLATGLLAGCDDEDDPPEPTESVSEPTSAPTSTQTEPTPTGPVEPTLPAEAEAATKAGAEAFVGYYWQVVNYAQHTGDVGPLTRISEDNCAGCNGGIRYITKVYGRGGRIIGGDFSLVSASSGRTPSGAWHVSTRVHVDRSKTTGAGKLDQVSRAGELEFLFGLENTGNAWHLTFLDMP